MPNGFYLKHLTAHAELIETDQNWRSELLEIARGRGVHNQAITASNFRIWKNLRFRSESEVRVAQALDKLDVLFLPNCKARLGIHTNRQNREADFLICFEGKWGILEVDGEPFHPPSRTSQDHDRDRLFRSHSIIVVEHFDANECYQNPDSVVQKFLEILKRA
jgi:very-short-patch-repair endonuclease